MGHHVLLVAEGVHTKTPAALSDSGLTLHGSATNGTARTRTHLTVPTVVTRRHQTCLVNLD